MVEAPFEVACRWPFGEELSPPTERRTAGEEDPREGTSKRPASGDGEAAAAKKRRTEPPTSKGMPSISHSSNSMKYGAEAVPPAIADLFARAAKANVVLSENPELIAEFCNLCSTALSRSSWAKYGSAYNKWAEFAKSTKRNLTWPLNEADKIAFICWNSKRGGLKPQTIQSYLSALENLDNLFGEKDNETMQKKLKKFLLKGAEHESNRVETTKVVNPITLEMLETIRRVLFSKPWKTLSKLALWAACTLAYWGVFRLGELFPLKENVFDKFSDLLWSDIEIFERGVIVTIKSPKVVGRKPEKVYLHQLTEKWVCPVRALKTLARKVHWEKRADQPVFLLDSGNSLTKKVFLKSINKLLKGTIYHSKKLQGKSFRSGIPSEVELFPKGFREKHVKILGRWAGLSCRSYMHFDAQEKERVFKKISGKLIRTFLRRKEGKAKEKETDQPGTHQQ
jgi:hypothetical protein